MIKMIDVAELDELLPEQDILILDLREPEDFRKYHIKRAKNCPYEQMEEWEQDALSHKKLLLYCERGTESLMASRKLNRRNNEIYTLIGGITAVYELETRNSIDRGKRNR